MEDLAFQEALEVILGAAAGLEQQARTYRRDGYRPVALASERELQQARNAIAARKDLVAQMLRDIANNARRRT
jgi:hypothetical protein